MMISLLSAFFIRHRAYLIVFLVLAYQEFAMHAARAGEPFLPAANANPEQLSAAELTALGARYEHAEGVPRDPAKAIALYCFAARKGYADAQYALGWMYANGRGMAKDDGLAQYFFEMAARQGHAQARELLRLVVSGTAPITPSCLLQTNAAPAESDLPRNVYPKGPIYQLVHKLAPRYGIDPQLALAIIHVESAFDIHAVSPKNAQGLMQLMPETARRFKVKNTFDPEDNIKGGLSYLQRLLNLYQRNVPLVLAAYNAGERAVENYQGIPPYAETLHYIQKITLLYGKKTHPFHKE